MTQHQISVALVFCTLLLTNSQKIYASPTAAELLPPTTVLYAEVEHPPEVIRSFSSIRILPSYSNSTRIKRPQKIPNSSGSCWDFGLSKLNSA